MTDNTYTKATRHWSSKAFGPLPTAEAFDVAHAMVRKGKHALAIAMYLRTDGATDSEVRAAVKKAFDVAGVQQSLFNYMRDNVAAGYLKRDAAAPKRDGAAVYKVELTAKGQAFVKRTLDAAKAKLEANGGDAPKAKRKASKRPAKVPATTPAAPVNEPASEPAQGSDGHAHRTPDWQGEQQHNPE